LSILIALIFLSSPDTLIPKIRELIKQQNLEEAEVLAHQYLRESRSEESYLLVWRLFKNLGHRDKGFVFLKEGRKVLKDETLFAHEFYIDAISRRDFKTAIKEALNLLVRGRNISWVKREIIRIKSFLGLDATIKEIKKWKKKHKKVRETDEILASLYINEGRLKDAVKVLGKEGDPVSLERLAEQALKEDKSDIALQALLSIKEKDRENSWHFLYAKIKEKEGKLEEAAENYKIAWMGGYKDAKTPLLELLMDRINDPEGVILLTKDNPDEWYMRALLRLGRFGEAESLCFYIKNEEMAYLCAELTLIRGDIEGADSLFNEILRRYGKGERVNDALLWLYLISNYGEETDFLYFLEMKNLYLQGKYAELEGKIKDFLKGARDSPLTPHYLYLLGSALEKERKYDEALSFFLEAGKAGESFVGAKSLLKAFHIAKNELKNIEFSKDILRKLLFLYPDSPYSEVARTYLESP